MFALLLLWLLAFAGPAAAAPTFPPLTGRVTDAAGVLPADVAAGLTSKLEALETSTGTQLVVATVPSLQDYPIDDYGYQLGRAWGIGQKGKNNGVILLIAPNERKVRVEIGFGLEERLTDGLAALVISREILPRFKAGDLPGGVVAGTDTLIAQLQLPADQARANVAAAEAAPRERRSSGGGGFGGIIWLIIIAVFVLSAIFGGGGGGGGGRRRRSSGIGEAILWGVASSVLSGGRGGGGGWGGGGGGGGGFSGGGGSFGGGGASGSW